MHGVMDQETHVQFLPIIAKTRLKLLDELTFSFDGSQSLVTLAILKLTGKPAVPETVLRNEVCFSHATSGGHSSFLARSDRASCIDLFKPSPPTGPTKEDDHIRYTRGHVEHPKDRLLGLFHANGMLCRSSTRMLEGGVAVWHSKVSQPLRRALKQSN